MGFDTINNYCNVISVVKGIAFGTDILNNFNLVEAPGFLIITIRTNVLYQNNTKEGVECIVFHIRDEHRRQSLDLMVMY